MVGDFVSTVRPSDTRLREVGGHAHAVLSRKLFKLSIHKPLSSSSVGLGREPRLMSVRPSITSL